MKVIFAYGEASFWTAVFSYGTEMAGFIEHDDALNAQYNEYLVIRKTKNIVSSKDYSWHKSVYE